MVTTKESATPTNPVPARLLTDRITASNADLTKQAPDAVKGLTTEIDALVRSGAANDAPRMGATVPDFALPDSAGRQVSLAALRRQGPVVVSFYRGQWCPYCDLQPRAYQEVLPQIRALGATLVAISPQTPDESLSTAQKRKLEFHVLSDANHP